MTAVGRIIAYRQCNRCEAAATTKVTTRFGVEQVCKACATALKHDGLTIGRTRLAKARQDRIAELEKMLRNVLGHNAAVKAQYKLTPALVEHIERVLSGR